MGVCMMDGKRGRWGGIIIRCFYVAGCRRPRLCWVNAKKVWENNNFFKEGFLLWGGDIQEVGASFSLVSPFFSRQQLHLVWLLLFFLGWR